LADRAVISPVGDEQRRARYYFAISRAKASIFMQVAVYQQDLSVMNHQREVGLTVEDRHRVIL